MTEDEKDMPVRIIEGPSATNSPDNSNSGNGAYVIFAVAVAVVVLLASSLGSCVAGIAELVTSDFAPYGGYYGDGYGPTFDDEDLHDMVRELLEDSSATGTVNFDS